MGFLGQASHTQEVQATVLLPGFQASCTLNVIGMVQTFLNDEQKDVFPLHDVSLYGLEQGNPAASMRIPELFVRKDQCHAVAFTQRLGEEQMGLMPRAERLAIYTSHYVIQGDFFMGTDSLISDFVHLSKSQFIAVTDAAFFPLFSAQAAMMQQAPLAYVHQSVVRMHHVL